MTSSNFEQSKFHVVIKLYYMQKLYHLKHGKAQQILRGLCTINFNSQKEAYWISLWQHKQRSGRPIAITISEKIEKIEHTLKPILLTIDCKQNRVDFDGVYWIFNINWLLLKINFRFSHTRLCDYPKKFFDFSFSCVWTMNHSLAFQSFALQIPSNNSGDSK